MRTLIIIAGGFLLLGLVLLIARWFGGSDKKASVRAAQIFLTIWLAVAGFNMWMGVARAGYAFREEFAIFLVIFGLPAIAAGFAWRKASGKSPTAAP